MQLTSAAPPSLESMSAGQGRYLTTRGLTSGLKLGDEAIFHAGLFADIGYDSNVFFSPSADAKSSPVLHLTPRLELTNAERDGSIPEGTYYDVFAALDWREYLSSDADIKSQNSFNPAAGGIAEFSSGQALSFALSDTFSRYQQAPYVVSQTVLTRDDNMASATLRFAPGGGRLKVMARYSNLIDKYEGDFDVASNMGNEFVLDIGWRWLPRTTIYVQAAQGAITYFHSGNGHSASYPLRTLAGIRGLLTEKLAVNLAAGYTNAFYSSGKNPSGWGNLGIVAELNYNISVLSQAGIGYHHDIANSPFIGQYYNMDAIYGSFRQMIAGRVVTYVYGRYEHRTFGSVSRTDNYLSGGLSIDYMIRNFFLAGVSYTVNVNSSSDTTAATGGVDYAKHVVLFRLGAVY